MLITAALRACQVIFAIIVLSISVSLVNGQIQNIQTAKGEITGGAPAETEYAAFVGAFGLLVALVGVVALFVEYLHGIIMSTGDGLATLLNLAGGISVAVALKGGSCSDTAYLETNLIVRGAGTISGITIWNPYANLTSRCHEAQAITAFMFMAFLAFGTTLVLGLVGKSGKKGSIV